MKNDANALKGMDRAAPVETGDTGFPNQAEGQTLVPADRSRPLLAQFRQQWQSGRSLFVEEFLKDHPEAQADPEVTLDLIYAEFVLRQESGSRPNVDSFLGRFPAYRERLEPLLSLDEALLAKDDETQTLVSPSGQAKPRRPAPTSEETIGRYQIITPLGQGGQAKVFRALHPHLRKDVVVKIGLVPFVGSGAERDQLMQEGRLLAQLDHPLLARVYDLDFHENHVFLVMEYIPGRTFVQWQEQEKPDARRTALLLARTARALAVAHKLGVTHCDLTPRNILIDDQGLPHLIDFGLSRLHHAWHEPPADPESVSGTLTFLSPEQARGETHKIGPRTDLFALGGVLYFHLTGKSLYSARDWVQGLDKARRCDFDRKALAAPGTPPRLAAICLRLLSENPDDRFPSAESLARDLEAFAQPPWHRRLPVQLAGAAALLACLALAAFLRRPSELPPQPDLKKEIVQPAPEDRKPRITMKARVDDRFFSLPQPLEVGQEIYVQARVPAGMHASLFLFTSDGALKHLVDWPVAADDTLRRFPDEEGAVVPLMGKPGTDVLVLAGNRAAPVTLVDLRVAWTDTQAWPVLPPERVWRMQAHSVAPLEKSRDFGKPRRGDDPEEQVQSRLEELRVRLRERLDLLEALAFSHTP